MSRSSELYEDKEVDRLKDEIERLREALWLIDNDAHSLDDAVKIARAALGEGE